jgi:hypothetical protein
VKRFSWRTLSFFVGLVAVAALGVSAQPSADTATPATPLAGYCGPLTGC